MSRAGRVWIVLECFVHNNKDSFLRERWNITGVALLVGCSGQQAKKRDRCKVYFQNFLAQHFVAQRMLIRRCVSTTETWGLHSSGSMEELAFGAENDGKFIHRRNMHFMLCDAADMRKMLWRHHCQMTSHSKTSLHSARKKKEYYFFRHELVPNEIHSSV